MYDLCDKKIETNETLTVGNMNITFLKFGDGQKVLKNVDELVFKFHQHSYFELFYCFKGAIEIFTETESFRINEKEILLVPSGIRHRFNSQSHDAYWRSIFISVKEISQKKNELALNEIGAVFSASSVAVFRDIPPTQQGMIEDVLNNKYKSKKLEFVTLVAFLLSLNTQSTNITNGKLSYDQRFLLLDDIINNHYNENIKFSVIAKKLYLSERQAARVIKEHYGASFKELIINNRLCVAEYMLCHTDMPMTYICTKTGFYSMSSFINAFKTKYGITPSEYRKGVTK